MDLSRWARPAGALALGLVAKELLAHAPARRHLLDLQGQVVLITGGSTGLGFALAQEFARHGAALAICARREEPLQRAQRSLEEAGAEVLAIPCDVSDRARVDALVAGVTERFGRIDVLVNNAGIIGVGPLETQTLEDFQQVMAINFWGVVHPTLAVLAGMRARHAGRIVNISSIGGRIPVPHLATYTSAKFAVTGFSRVLRAELGQDGITVTTVIPGLMRTGSHLNALFKGDRAAEYNLFSALAVSPFSAMDAREAARRVVEATRRGDAELVMPARIVLPLLSYGLLPGLTTDLLRLLTRFLPRASTPDGQVTRSGRQVEQSTLLQRGFDLARELNQDLPKVPG